MPTRQVTMACLNAVNSSSYERAMPVTVALFMERRLVDMSRGKYAWGFLLARPASWCIKNYNTVAICLLAVCQGEVSQGLLFWTLGRCAMLRV